MSDWNPELYNRFRRFRAEPVDLILARLPVSDYERIADLGCGSGENTIELARRTARGSVLGIDSSAAMIDAARARLDDLDPELLARISFEEGDIAMLDAAPAYTIIFSNAALQWISGHRAVLVRWFRALAPGGRMVVQMPANDHETAKVEMNRLAREEPWRSLLSGVERAFREVPPPEKYREMLSEIGFSEVDCHYHTFEHPMRAASEVVDWYRSTGLRPFVNALPEDRRPDFIDAYRERLERAYGTTGPMIFTFRRLFLWARRPVA